MEANQIQALRAEIVAACSPELLAARNDGEIATAVSVGRKKRSAAEIGNGVILETLGLATGNALLDVLNTNEAFRYVRPLIAQGRLVIGSPLAQQSVQSFVPAILTQEQADALCALGWVADPVSSQQVSETLGAG